MDEAEKRIRCCQGNARIAEIDLMVKNLLARKKRIFDYLASLGDKRQETIADPVLPTEAYSEAFEELWKIYAKATDRHAEKRKAFDRFKKIPVNEYPLIRKAIDNYTQSRECRDGFSRYFVRFLKEDFWTVWINRKPSAGPDDRSARDIVKGVLRK